MSVAFRCADSSEEREEPLFATASVVHRWLLIEQPGAWGPDALSQSGLPPELALEIRTRARAARVRVVLIRRGRRFSGDRRRCYLGTTTAARTDLMRLDIADARDLLDLDLDLFAGGGSVPGAVPHEDPLVLVCTHGRHDACCAIRGNQVSRVVCSLDDVDGWECSHIGGDRFAANLVLFPHGLYYGRVAPETAPGMIAAFRDGRMDLDHLRGRCAYAFPVQAADYFLRRETGLLGLEEVVFRRRENVKDGVRSTFITPEGLFDVTVAVDRDGEPHRLTCGAMAASIVPRYGLLHVALADDPA